MSPLTREERTQALRLARTTIEIRVTHSRAPHLPEIAGLAESAAFDAEQGCFVSLHRHGDLRGCIGNIQPAGKLRETLVNNAIAAATRDPRFPPVGPVELPDLEIEISVLSVLEPFTSPAQIEIGVHGIYLARRGRRGVLLPQVAPEYGWGGVEFLEHTAVKAGLAPQDWKTAELWRFSAQVFSEKDDAAHGR